ncbi:hypothetical protein AKJ16_DCAP10760 [Drosera capensis]
MSVLHPSPQIRSSFSSSVLPEFTGTFDSRSSHPLPETHLRSPIPRQASLTTSPSSSISFLKLLILLTHLKISTTSSHFRLFFLHFGAASQLPISSISRSEVAVSSISFGYLENLEF